MQITVDTEKDSAAVLSNVGKFLVLGYGTLADKTAIVAGAAPQPAGATAVPLAPVREPIDKGDDMPADDFEKGKGSTDAKAASVFGGSAAPAAPPVPPAPPAPPIIPPAPPAIPPAPGAALAPVERDTAGVPYDARIHNKSRTKKQDGTWKLAKGIDPAVVQAVLAEIRGPLVQTPVAPAAGTTTPSATAGVSSAGTTVPPVPVPPAGTAPPVPPPAPPSVGNAAPAAAVPAAISFRAVMQKVTENQTAGRLTKAQVDHALAQVGFKPDELAPLVMPANAALLAAFNSLIDAALGVQQ